MGCSEYKYVCTYEVPHQGYLLIGEILMTDISR